MTKYTQECEVGEAYLRQFRKQNPGAPQYAVQLVLLQKHLTKLNSLARGNMHPVHQEIKRLMSLQETQRSLKEARQNLAVIAHGKDKRLISIANNAIRQMRHEGNKTKRLGVGFGQLHRPMSAGAVDSKRSRH